MNFNELIRKMNRKLLDICQQLRFKISVSNE